MRLITSRAEKRMEERFALKREAIDILNIVVAEWTSDPMSVQCFDLRTVERAKHIVARLKDLEPDGFAL